MIDYLIIINVFSLIICYYDKLSAIKNKYRISEKLLLLASLLGGTFGFILGMILFHHKTKKLKFKVLEPIFLILWIIIIIQYI